MDKVFEPIVTISLAIVGVALLAVLVSRNANTAGVLKAYGQTFASMIGAATAPVTGAGSMPGLSTPILGMPSFPSLYG